MDGREPLRIAAFRTMFVQTTYASRVRNAAISTPEVVMAPCLQGMSALTKSLLVQLYHYGKRGETV